MREREVVDKLLVFVLDIISYMDSELWHVDGMSRVALSVALRVTVKHNINAIAQVT